MEMEKETNKYLIQKKYTSISDKLKLEGKGIIMKNINRIWQQQWDQETRERLLYRLQNKGCSVRNRGGSRREEVIS